MAEACQTVLFQLPKQSIVYEVVGRIHAAYRPVHTYLSIVLCIVGTLCNVCNIIILTRPKMRTPVNTILSAMAFCDTVVLFSNLVYTTHYTFVAFPTCLPEHWSRGWAMFLIAHAHLSLVGHSSSVWLSVMLAFIRYLTLRQKGKMSGFTVGLKHSYMSIAFVLIFVTIMNSPNFLVYKIIEMPLQDACRITDESVLRATTKALAFVPGVSDLAVRADCLVFRMAFWISGTVFKMVPCILLTLFVCLLMRILKDVAANRDRLLRSRRISNNVCNNGRISADAPSGLSNNTLTVGRRASRIRRGERTDRTTRMLLAIVCVFLVTELPQGVMAVLSGLFSEEFRRYIYNGVGDILDLLSLFGACTSFIIYCSMSGQFRMEFRRLLIPKRFSCWKESEKYSRRQSDAYTKMSFLSPCHDMTINGSSDRSATLTLAGSCNSVRRIPPDDSTRLLMTTSNIAIDDGFGSTADSPPLRDCSVSPGEADAQPVLQDTGAPTPAINTAEDQHNATETGNAVETRYHRL